MGKWEEGLMEEKKTKLSGTAGSYTKEVDGVTYVRSKCSVCTGCWIAINGSVKGMCQYGGPFEGYVKDKDLDKPDDK